MKLNNCNGVIIKRLKELKIEPIETFTTYRELKTIDTNYLASNEYKCIFDETDMVNCY